MSHAFLRHSAYLALGLGFLCSLLLGAEFDLLGLASESRSRHQRLELDEMLGLSGLFSILLAAIAAWNSRLAGRERHKRTEAERTANFDVLTSIANRRLFFERLEAAFGRPDRACAIILIDLDGFKAINDTHGHAAGDRMLMHVARQIETLTGPNCLAARLGGDEFALALDGAAAGERQVEGLALRLKAAIGQPVTYDGIILSVGASVGIAFMSDATMSPTALLEAADGAMYRVKRRNRDRLAA